MEWLCHEVFAESRRHIYLNHIDLRSLKGELTKFCISVLDDPGFELEDEIVQRYRPHSVSSVFRKTYDLIDLFLFIKLFIINETLHFMKWTSVFEWLWSLTSHL